MVSYIPTGRGPSARPPHRFAAVLLASAALLLAALPVFSQQSTGTQSTGSGASPSLTVSQAVKEALSHSSDVQSALAAWSSARDKALQAKLNMLPSVSLSGSYTRLSQLPSSDTNLSLPLGPGGSSVNIPITEPQNAFTLGASLRYPIFTGFRLLEAAKIADLQSTGKKIAIQIVRNALTFEVERAYWEAVRASSNVKTMEKNLDLVRVLRGQVKDEVDQGLATQSDLLSAEERYSQAQIGVNDSVAARNQAFLVLASLLGQDKTGAELAASGGNGFLPSAPAAYTLATNASASSYPELSGKLDPSRLVSQALADRPEMQTATVGVETAKHAAKAALGSLSPTLSVIGDYTYANPNQRVLFPSSSQFTGTWDVGVAVNIDVGKLPSNVAGSSEAGKQLASAQAQAQGERTKIVLDVRRSILSFDMARQDLALTKSMVPQAEENLRVTQQKYDHGLAKRSDVLQSELALLRSQFAVTNREVGLQIAAADLARAVGILSK